MSNNGKEAPRYTDLTEAMWDALEHKIHMHAVTFASDRSGKTTQRIEDTDEFQRLEEDGDKTNGMG